MFRPTRLIAAAILGTFLSACSAVADDGGTVPLPDPPKTIEITKGPTASNVGGTFKMDLEWKNCKDIAKVVVVATDSNGTVIGNKDVPVNAASATQTDLTIVTTAAAGDTVTFQAFARKANGDDIATSKQKSEKSK